jgi:hypothetical protein
VTQGYSYGMSTIILILKGSLSQKIKLWMKDLTYYGSMKNENVKSLNEFTYKAIEMGYLENHDVGGCVTVLRCTDTGIEFGKEFEMKLNKMMDEDDGMVEHFILN